MTCTKRKCVGINVVQRRDNQRWFPWDHASGLNPWSSALTKYSQNTNNPHPSGREMERCFHWRDPGACSWWRKRQRSAGSRGDHRGSLCSWDTALMLSSLSAGCVFAIFYVPGSGEWEWALSPFTCSVEQDESTCSYKGWMWNADACWEI